MKNWFEIKNNQNGVVDISLHDEIGIWGVSAADFIQELKQHQSAKSINLSIHSPGGNVLDGLAMYNALKAHPAKIHGKVEGIAASAASFILMASDTISMPEDSFLMIHNAHGGAMGEADDLREAADVMDKLQDSIVNIYEKRTGLSESEVRAMMKAETWLNAAEALDSGFIDTITDRLDIAAKINTFNKYFKSMPVSNDAGAEKVNTAKEFEQCLRDSGLSKRLAQALTSRAKTVFRGEPDEPDDSLREISEALDKVKIPTQINQNQPA